MSALDCISNECTLLKRLTCNAEPSSRSPSAAGCSLDIKQSDDKQQQEDEEWEPSGEECAVCLCHMYAQLVRVTVREHRTIYSFT